MQLIGWNRCSCLLIVVLSVLPLNFTLFSGKQRIVEEPVDTRAVRGSTVLLRCRVENQKGPVTWTKDGFALGSDRSLPDYERYSMVGSGAEGEFHLRIENVQLSDDAVYQCQLLQTRTSEGDVSKSVKLIVLVTPHPARLIGYGELITGVEGREFTVACSADNGKPAAEISWVIAEHSDGSGAIRNPAVSIETGNREAESDKNDNSDGSGKLNKKKAKSKKRSKNEKTVEATSESPQINRITTNITKENSLFTVRSNLRYIPAPRDDGKFLVCLVRHETVEGTMAAAAELIIEYAPKVTVSLNSTEVLKEGGSGSLVCNADAKPNRDLQYVWKKDGNVLPRGQNNPVLILGESDLRRENQGSLYECEVSNTVGTRKDGFDLQMEYPPILYVKEKQVPADVGDSKTLRCEVDSNPPAQIEWTKLGNKQMILSRDENYTVSNIRNWKEGTYLCTAIVPGFPSVTEEVAIHIRGPPRVIMVPSAEITGEDQVAQIICEVKGYPRPDAIKWYKAGRYLKSNGRFEQQQMYQKDGIVSILKIRLPKSADFGIYNCSAENERGTGSGVTRLMASDPIPLYLLIPGIICSFVALLLVVLCCILCNRRALCRTKTTTLSDDHSDVTVKVEALDGSGVQLDCYPDMYSPPFDNGLYAGKVNAQLCSRGGRRLPPRNDYIPLPQDNPDVDLLPPPYCSYVHTPPSSLYGHSPSTFHPGNSGPGQNGHLVQMTYLDADPKQNYVFGEPRYGTNSDYYTPGTSFAHNNLITTTAETPIYYPNVGMSAPLATLEPVQELPTPEESYGNIDGFSVPSNSQGAGLISTFQPRREGGLNSPNYGKVVVTAAGNITAETGIQIPRCHSNGSTHV